MTLPERVTVRVRRQDDAAAKPYWQSFTVASADAVTIADALEAINREPRTADGTSVPPIAWAASCTFPTCGSCAMRIGAPPKLACKTRLDEAVDRRGVVTLQPLEKFPLRRDLWVDLGRMQSDFERVRAFVDTDAPAERILRRALQRCTACGICLDACPEVRTGAPFVGPAAIAAAYEANLAAVDPVRITTLMHKGGIDDCGQAQNCLAACPEAVPLDEAIAATFRDVTRSFFSRFRRDPR